MSSRRSASREVRGVPVYGLAVDAQTRCAHYSGPTDVIALRFRCCDRWYPCIDCHRALADHEPVVWPIAEHHAEAVLCGLCGHRLTVAAYLACDSSCPACGGAFNPGCVLHRQLYFELDAPTPSD